MKFRLLLILSALALWCWTHPPVLQIWAGHDFDAVRHMRAHGAACWPTLHGVRIQATRGGVQALAEWCRHLELSRSILSQNIANARTTKTADGTPYRRQFVLVDGQGQTQLGVDQGDYNWVYDPSNPNAVQEGDHQGYVAMPDVNEIQERACLDRAEQQLREYRQALKRLSDMVDPHGRMHLDPLVSEPAAPPEDGELSPASNRVSFESLMNSMSDQPHQALPAQPAAQEGLGTVAE